MAKVASGASTYSSLGLASAARSLLPSILAISTLAGRQRLGREFSSDFLDFAKTGRLDDSTQTGEDADSAFEEDVADVIRGFGFLADNQVGSAGFRIDLGIRHPEKPGTYILAVECDGATYHSALWARERDRLRQDVLEHLGWHFHRIWSTDWFYNRRVEIERLRTALFDARERAERGVRIVGANEGHSVPVAPASPDLRPIEVPPIVERQMPSYKRAVFRVNSPYEPHEAPFSMLVELVQKIVTAEGPIHVEEVARRIAACFDREKAGSRILAATRTALARSGNSDLLTDGTFWYTQTQAAAPPVRDRSMEAGATIKADNISLLEIKAAFKIARDDNAGGDEAELIRTVAKLMGFRRVGPDLQARITAGLTP
jgi:very-short-patch-repair endonuclease